MTSLLSALECPICLQLYSEPRILTNCGHSLCTRCIDALSIAPPEVECPMCSVVTYYASIRDLPINFTLVGIMEAALRDKESVDPLSEVTETELRNCLGDGIRDSKDQKWWMCWCFRPEDDNGSC